MPGNDVRRAAEDLARRAKADVDLGVEGLFAAAIADNLVFQPEAREQLVVEPSVEQRRFILLIGFAPGQQHGPRIVQLLQQTVPDRQPFLLLLPLMRHERRCEQDLLAEQSPAGDELL